MFCPDCQGEYRPGISRCATCDVDLVEEPSRSLPVPVSSREEDGPAPVEDSEAMVNYCGFLTLQEARQARDLLRRERISSEILIRDATAGRESVPQEEYWLRVPVRSFQAAAALLGYDEALERSSAAENQTLSCSECGEPVSEHETFCAHCGARFDE